MFENLKKSFTSKLLLVMIIFWAVLALIFGFTDLEISKAVVDENSAWGIFGRDYVEAPGYGLIGIAIAVLIGGYNKDIRKQKIAGYVTIGIGFILFVLGIFFDSEDLILDGGSIFICLTAFVIITFNKDWQKYRKISVIITILTIILMRFQIQSFI